MKYINYIYIILLMLTWGCKKVWLDVKADRNQAIPSTTGDFQAILDYYLEINTERINLGELASDGHYVLESAWTTAKDKPKNAYTWSHEKPYTYSGGTFDWGDTYVRIFRCNLVLDGLQKLSSTIENNDIKGQALFHRADAFFRAAQAWAPPYESASAASDKSIPIRLQSDVTAPSHRSTVKETYDQITEDLKEASNLLPSSPIAKTRPSKIAALAMLARVYLSKREYEMAGNYAHQTLNLYNSLNDFNTLNKNQNYIGDFRTNPEILFFIRMTSDISNSSFLTTSCFISPDLYALYNDNDLRKVLFFRLNTNGTIAFKGNYNNSATELFVGPTTSEMYLIRAEAYARSDKKELAMKDLNDLLRTRWKKNPDGTTTYVDQTAANADEALSIILTERRKELILRGLRWSDLRRLNKEDRFKVTLTRTIGGQTYTLAPNSYKYTFPIPDDIIQQTGMQQNPGWDDSE